MNLIVVVDKNWGIGKNNDLLFKLPADMKRFREHTVGKTVVMGSNTLLSFPGGKPLPSRKNIVLWPGGEKRTDCTVVGSLTELATTLKNEQSEDVFIVGGAMFYKTMLPYCDTAYITKADADGGAEVFFENLDEKENWQIKLAEPPLNDNGVDIRFLTYVNSAPKGIEELA